MTTDAPPPDADDRSPGRAPAWAGYTPDPVRSSARRELRRARRRKLASAAVIAAFVAAVVVAVVLTTRGVGTTPPAACSPAPCADDGGNLRVFVDGAAILTAGGTSTVVQVTVHVVNASQVARAVNALDFSLRDAAGTTHGSLQVAGAQCGVFEAVQLGPGATLGPKVLCFSAPASPGARLTLVWAPGTRPIDIAVSAR
jgi:hypothetical protein